jgi:hypothetical protein
MLLYLMMKKKKVEHFTSTNTFRIVLFVLFQIIILVAFFYYSMNYIVNKKPFSVEIKCVCVCVCISRNSHCNAANYTSDPLKPTIINLSTLMPKAGD